jgi:uncharacterized protein (TIGR04255 family)
MDNQRSPNFTLESVAEVHLPRAPLAKVLTQVQFSRTPALTSAELEEGLARALAPYPVRRQGLATGIALAIGASGGPLPLPQPPPTAVRIFAEAAGTWQVTITETSVALETSGYDSRDDFCDRAQVVLAAVASVAEPPVVDRVGLRYVDRLRGDQLRRINEYVVPQLRILHGSVGEGLSLVHSVSDTLVRIGENEMMQIRSGLLPPNGSFDPALPPMAEPTWVLDLDVFTVQGGFAFDPSSLSDRLRRYADHAYSFFRFATTDAFQAEFGRPAVHDEPHAV